MSIADRLPLLRLLADGEVHSGESLAETLGVTRAAIWKQLKMLEGEMDLSITAVPGRGYRLADALELFDAASIAAALHPDAAQVLDALRIEPVLESTNSSAAEARPAVGRGTAILCELQTAGRGRRGRSWVSGFADGLTMSLAFRFDLPLSSLSGISLAVGVTTHRVLADLGLDGIGLKWPNDVLHGDAKLAGILVEASGEIEGPTLAVIGIGVNWRAASERYQAINRPWTDLQRLGLACSRNLLAGRLLSALLQTCIDYQQQGVGGYLDAWRRQDRLCGREVEVRGGDRVVRGRYLGIDDSGAMILDGPRGRQVFAAGEVSLRER